MTIQTLTILMPYVCGLTAILFITLLSLHLYHVRRSEFEKEIELGEKTIDTNISELDDAGVLAELEHLESSSYTLKKE